jgi:hypothetical protein
MKKTKLNNRYRTIDTYYVEGITIETDEDIINYCDRNCFGGRVYRYGKTGTAKVECDID